MQYNRSVFRSGQELRFGCPFTKKRSFLKNKNSFSCNSMKMSPRSSMKRDCNEENMSSDSSNDSSGRRGSKSKRMEPLDKNSEEYRKRRERNNLAVKKSRSKTKLKTQQTVERVNQLREENEMLESKIKLLTKELSFLKDLFLAHAGSFHAEQNLSDVDLTFLNEDSEHSSPVAAGVKKEKR